MVQLMEKTLAEINKLSVDEQESFAAWILEELTSEQRWDAAFAQSGDLLDQLAEEALAEHRVGKTLPLDSDTLSSRLQQNASGNFTAPCQKKAGNRHA